MTLVYDTPERTIDSWGTCNNCDLESDFTVECWLSFGDWHGEWKCPACGWVNSFSERAE